VQSEQSARTHQLGKEVSSSVQELRNVDEQQEQELIEELLNAHAVTIHQPFAQAIMCGLRTVENRSWPLTLDPSRGRWLFMHVSGREKPGAEHNEALEALKGTWPNMPNLALLPRSAILGWFHVAGVAKPQELPYDQNALGPLCWVIDRVRILASPLMNVKGAQGLWRPTPETIEMIRAAPAASTAALCASCRPSSPGREQVERSSFRVSKRRQPSLSSRKCHAGHPLNLDYVESGREVFCDGGCGVVLLPGETCWSCEECDFDLCQLCCDPDHENVDVQRKMRLQCECSSNPLTLTQSPVPARPHAEFKNRQCGRTRHYAHGRTIDSAAERLSKYPQYQGSGPPLKPSVGLVVRPKSTTGGMQPKMLTLAFGVP
jgi:hypothetical protein